MGLFNSLLGKGKNAPASPQAQSQNASAPQGQVLPLFDYQALTAETLYAKYCKLFQLRPYIDQLYFMSQPDEDLVSNGFGVVGVCNDGCIYSREYEGTITRIKMNDIINIDVRNIAITSAVGAKFEFPLCEYTLTTNDKIDHKITLENSSGENSDSNRFANCVITFKKLCTPEKTYDTLEDEFEASKQQNKALFAAGGIDGDSLFPMDKVLEAYNQQS